MVKTLQKYPLADLALVIVFRSYLFNKQQDIALLDFTKSINSKMLCKELEDIWRLGICYNREG